LNWYFQLKFMLPSLLFQRLHMRHIRCFNVIYN
jgi:hypothetical protein